MLDSRLQEQDSRLLVGTAAHPSNFRLYQDGREITQSNSIDIVPGVVSNFTVRAVDYFGSSIDGDSELLLVSLELDSPTSSYGFLIPEMTREVPIGSQGMCIYTIDESY